VLICCAHERAEWPPRRLPLPGRRVDLTLHAAADRRPLRRPAGLELAAGAVLETRTRPAP
jgi:hypothetical protein